MNQPRVGKRSSQVYMGSKIVSLSLESCWKMAPLKTKKKQRNGDSQHKREMTVMVNGSQSSISGQQTWRASSSHWNKLEGSRKYFLKEMK